MADRGSRPLLAITVGDPAGIGPEIILKVLAHADVFARCRPLVIGDRRILERAAPWVGQPAPSFETITNPQDGAYRAGTVPILDLGDADPAQIPEGEESAKLLAQHIKGAKLIQDKRKGDAIDLALGTTFKGFGPVPTPTTQGPTLPPCPTITVEG